MLPVSLIILSLLQKDVIQPQVGLLSTLVGPSAKVAPVSKGLSVDFTITPAGEVSVSGDELKTPIWKGSCRLSEADLAYRDGILSANFSLANGAGTSIQGVRFDFVSVTEAYKVKLDDGTEGTKTRMETVEFSSPCYFGDLADQESSISIPGSVKGIKLNPETVNVRVHAVVSGLTFHKQFLHPKSSLKGCGVVVDPNGDVVVGEGNHKALWRFSEDGEFKGEFGTLPAEGREVALNPVTHDYLVGLYNQHNCVRVTQDGTTAPAFPGNLDEWPGDARFDSKGRLFMKVGTKVSTFEDYKISASSGNRIGGFSIRPGDPFDLSGDQVLWILATNNLVKTDPNFGNSETVVKMGTGGLGEIVPTGRSGMRCSPDGGIFLSEDGVNAKILPRVSVFDAQGRFVRTFGMAGQKANFHAYLPGQFHATPRDFAFGSSGQVYVTQYDSTCGLIEFIQF